MALPLKRLHPEPVDRDAIFDSDYSDYVSDDVNVFGLADLDGNRIQLINNISGASIDPDAVSTYDAAPIGSLFIDGPGGKVWVKSAATTWTDQTA